MEKIKAASLMTAIKTPYKPDGDVDLESYDRLVEAQIERCGRFDRLWNHRRRPFDGLGRASDADCAQRE